MDVNHDETGDLKDLGDLRAENQRLLALWNEAKGYGWRLTKGRPFVQIGSMQAHPSLLVFVATPPTDSDPRINWAGIWQNVAVVNSETNKREYYISFPHWFEAEVIKDRNDRMSWSDWMWGLSWGRYASTGEGFSD